PDNSSRPPSWRGSASLDHFAEVGIAEPAFWQELVTSVLTAGCAAAIAVGAGFLAAYGLARAPFRSSRVVTQGFLVLASLPAMAYVIPLSDLMRRVHLLDTFAAVVLSEAAATAPLAVRLPHLRTGARLANGGRGADRLAGSRSAPRRPLSPRAEPIRAGLPNGRMKAIHPMTSQFVLDKLPLTR